MEEEPDRGGDPEQNAGGSLFFQSFLTICALQLEEELRAVLREQRERSKRNEMRINFRRVQKIKKEAEAGERLREKQVECLERLSRMEGLRRLARRRIGLHLMPKDTRWVNTIPLLLLILSLPATVLYNLLPPRKVRSSGRARSNRGKCTIHSSPSTAGRMRR